jgi:glycosyltransferase involved in cell wall biosynthesis
MILDIGAGPPPFFTIVLPTYNRVKLLADAIRSVRNQTVIDWELIIIDDGSHDETYDRVYKFLQADARIRYHFATNRGLAMARNIGLMTGRGKYFTFLDSDDEYLPDHLELRAGYLNDHPEVELLHGGVEIIGPDTVADKFDLTRQIPIAECVVGGTFVLRRDLAERLQGFRDILYGDDNDFYRRAENAGAIIHKIDMPTYRYNRTQADSICAIVEREGLDGMKSFRGIRG